MKSAQQLIQAIGPHIAFSGSSQLALAVELTKQRLLDTLPEKINFTQEIYPQVADQFGLSSNAATKAIYRAVERCWEQGDHAVLDPIIGRSLPERPAPREFILYLSYYLLYEMPYHKAAEIPSLPLPF